jgi:hypothetical protein
MRGKAAVGIGLLPFFATMALFAQANMRRDAALSLYLGTNGTNNNHRFYAACMDSSNGLGYFAATYAYKVDVREAVPKLVGNGISLARHASCAVMNSTAQFAYVATSSTIFQIMANGANAPLLTTDFVSIARACLEPRCLAVWKPRLPMARQPFFRLMPPQ